MHNDVRRPVEAYQAKPAPLSFLADLLCVEAAWDLIAEPIGSPPDHRRLADAGCSGEQEDVLPLSWSSRASSVQFTVPKEGAEVVIRPMC